METHMLTRKTRLVLATLTGALLAVACGGKGYGTTAPPPPPPPPPSAPRQYGSGHGVPDIHTGHDRRDCWRYRDLRVRVGAAQRILHAAGRRARGHRRSQRERVDHASVRDGGHVHVHLSHPPFDAGDRRGPLSSPQDVN